MKMMTGQKSKFAVLRIDDDSDSSDDGFKQVMRSKKPHAGGAAGGNAKGSRSANKAGSGGGPLTVHAVQSKSNKNKKSKKKPSTVSGSDGFNVQMDKDDVDERKFKEDLREALRQSKQEADTTTASIAESNGQSSTNPNALIDASLADIDSQSAALVRRGGDAGGNADSNMASQLAEMWRLRLVNTTRQLQEQGAALIQAQIEANKYRSRYKKICELLKDTELKEKAQLVVELDRARAVESELAAQIDSLQGQLMQARTRIGELEGKSLTGAAGRK